MTEAEKLFNQVFKRWIDRQSFILSFRVTSDQGMKGAKEQIQAEKVGFVNDLIQGGEYDKISSTKQAFSKKPS